MENCLFIWGSVLFLICVQLNSTHDAENESSLWLTHGGNRNLLSWRRDACTLKTVDKEYCLARCRHGRRCKSGSFCCLSKDGRRCCVDIQRAANITLEQTTSL